MFRCDSEFDLLKYDMVGEPILNLGFNIDISISFGDDDNEEDDVKPEIKQTKLKKILEKIR